MGDSAVKERGRNRSPGWWTHLVVYVVLVGAMYIDGTREIPASAITEHQERFFRVAVQRVQPAAPEARFQAGSLWFLRSAKPDASTVNFLLPEGRIEIDQGGGHDTHAVTVLERHPQWQLIEYMYANTSTSVSRYRAYRDHIEPVSFRWVMNAGLAFYAMILVIPALIIAALANFVWNSVSRARRTRTYTHDPDN